MPPSMPAANGAGTKATAPIGPAGREPSDPKAPTLDVQLTARAERAGDAGDATRVCAGECVQLELEIAGGAMPYTITWGDDALSGLGPHRVCPAADATYEVRVEDTPPSDDEFTRPKARGSARIDLTVKPCDDAPPPPPESCERKPSRDLYPSNKWWWQGGSVFTAPIVAHLVDHNGDAVIDARDGPTVVIVVSLPDGPTQVAHGALLVLEGTGRELYRTDNAWIDSTPAVADLDGDRRPEIVMVQAFDADTFPEPGSAHRRLAVLQIGDGRFTTRFSRRLETETNRRNGPLTIAIADLDQDGSPEIIAGLEVFDADGDLRWVAGDGGEGAMPINAPTAVDLDGDGFLEVITGSEAYRHDGSPLFTNEEVVEASDGVANQAFTAVADLDADGAPEIVVTTQHALFVLDAAGKTLRRRELTNTVASPFVPTIASIDPTRAPAILLSDGSALHLFRGDLTPIWSVPIAGPACCGGAVAFDFLGDGWAEVAFGDDERMLILDGLDGHVLFEAQRAGGNRRFDYPVIADIDDDGAADMIMNHGMVAANVPSVQVWSEPGFWNWARRIMNQHSYHVTNVTDDGAIPQYEEPHWKGPNSFRAQLGEAPETRCEP